MVVGLSRHAPYHPLFRLVGSSDADIREPDPTATQRNFAALRYALRVSLAQRFGLLVRLADCTLLSQTSRSPSLEHCCFADNRQLRGSLPRVDRPMRGR